MATATPVDWPLPPNPPPLEHQFLPPSLPRPASWGDDAARLQQLMLGSPAPAAAARPSFAASASSGHRDLGGLFDFDHHQPLPSGWERCLDLKSGEVYVVKSNSNIMGALERPNRSNSKQLLDLHPKVEDTKPSKAPTENDTREDWSFRWLQRKPAVESERLISTGNCLKQHEAVNLTREDEDRVRGSQHAERETLCLDLDLKLTSKHQSDVCKSSTNREMNEMVKLPSAKSVSIDRPPSDTLVSAAKLLTSATSARIPVKDESNMLGQPQQQWRWRLGESSNPDPHRESTMATAVCSSCLMYVVLRKTNPTCPRCANPIILDCSSQRSSKRPRLDLTPNDLSLSTDFSS